jgi:ERCC4-type nuclease|nr:MAG TPA: ERCC4 domain protein [Caudoviricetes sp.]
MGDKKGIDIKKCKYKIVVDSREKVNKHILNSFEKGFEYKVSHHDMYRGKKSKIGDPIEYYIQEKGLKVGDYTIAVQLPNKEVINFKDKVVIERKADLNELCCNLFDKKDEEGKTRLERELERAKEQGIKVYLVIETTDMHSKILSSKHFRYDKASKVSPASFSAILMALCSRYNINVWYTDKANSGRLIHDLLYYEAREYLKGL